MKAKLKDGSTVEILSENKEKKTLWVMPQGGINPIEIKKADVLEIIEFAFSLATLIRKWWLMFKKDL